MSDYYDSAEGIMISKYRVICELKDHGVVDFNEFFDDLGDKKLYSAQAVLDWLGYYTSLSRWQSTTYCGQARASPC